MAILFPLVLVVTLFSLCRFPHYKMSSPFIGKFINAYDSSHGIGYKRLDAN